MELPKMKMQNFDDLFGMNSGAGDISEYMAEGKVIEVELDNLVDFMDHPFKVLDDDRMAEMIESIRQYGVMNPALVRPLPGGKYEIIAGHRRKHACEKLGLATMPVRVLELEEEDAIILMVQTNLSQREELLPSEKARAYRMKSDAIKRHQGVRGKNTIEEIGEGTSDSVATVKRFLRLSYLTDSFLDMVDEKKIGQEQAIHISYLNEELQTWIYEILEQSQVSMTTDQAKDLRKVGEEGYLDKPKIWEILMRTVKKKRKYTLKQDVLDRYFTEGTSDDEIEQTIISALDAYMRTGGEL
jgi:ParB family chromosome partitioning protein